MDKAELDKILNRYGKNPSQIIAILHEIQDAERYLPEPDLRYVAQELKISVAQIFHIATFYKAFSLKPKGKHICNVCLGTACHVRGAPLVLEELERKLGIKAGDTTEDREFSLSTVNCLGACALGPLVTIDGEYFGNMNTAKVEKMLEQVRAQGNGKKKLEEETKEAIAEAEPVKEKISETVPSKSPVAPEKKAESAEEKAREKTSLRKKTSAPRKKSAPAKPKAGKKGGKK